MITNRRVHTSDNIFKACSAPKWYPSNPAKLKAQLEKNEIFAATNYSFKTDETKIRAMIMPHASIFASGNVATAATRILNKHHYKKIIVVGLTHGHYGAKTPFILMPPAIEKYQTPLGVIPVESELSTTIQNTNSKLFSFHKKSFEEEHSLEIELPFLQFHLKNFSILPLLVAAPNNEQLKQAANILKQYIDNETLIIVSSDFTHFGNHFGYTPFTENIKEKIKRLDSIAINHIESQSQSGFDTFSQKTGTTICGRNPIKLLLALLEENAFGKVYPHLVAYDTSAKDVNFDHSVSYVALMFTNKDPKTKPLKDQFTQYEQQDLLSTARLTLANLFSEKPLPLAFTFPHTTQTESKPMGAFVTLTTKQPLGRLRGCIGRITSSTPLYKTIIDMTKAAALKDHRFAPVTKAELDNIDIALSILSKPQPTELKNIVIGKHGIILEHGTRSSVYLPEVATDQGWDLPTTLASLSKKAGLQKDTWRNPKTKFKTFTSLKIKEVKQ